MMSRLHEKWLSSGSSGGHRQYRAKRAEDGLRESEERYRQAAEQLRLLSTKLIATQEEE